MRLRRFVIATLMLCGPMLSVAHGQQHTAGVPVLSSRPGAAYTVYLDPAGFNFNGTWGGGSTPGNNLGLNNRTATDTFNAADVTEIRAFYAVMANQYRSFDVNVTTVDPAIVAGQAANDAQRQAYYDSQPRMMHTIIGPPGNAGWQGAADGLAIAGISTVASPGSGIHTNFMFSQDVNTGSAVGNGTYIGNIASHEVGHTFGLSHQSDYTGPTKVNEYSFGSADTGNGSYVPTMGNGSDRQRVTWRSGNANAGGTQTPQNDVAVILANSGMTLVDSGIGHTRATATPLPLAGSVVDVTSPLHAGWISPASSINPQPLGSANSTKDVFSFTATALSTVVLTLNDGNDLLTPGTADNGATFRGHLSIFDAFGTLVGSGIEDPSTLFATYTGTLTGGIYFAEITSFGGFSQSGDGFNDSAYYDMGGYFLTGSGFTPVPEPSTLLLVAMPLLVYRLRRVVARTTHASSIA